MKGQFNFVKILIVLTFMVIIIFLFSIISNKMPSKVKFDFEQVLHDASFINNSIIDVKNGETNIYIDIKPEIFKEYNYHSYISGDGKGRKIDLKLYLISNDQKTCYNIKSYCYNYSDMNNLQFIGNYCSKIIDNTQNYNLAVYVTDTNILYVTDIEV